MKALGIVCQGREIHTVLRRLQRLGRGPTTVVALTPEVCERVHALGHACRTLDSYGEEGHLHRRSVHWIDDWAERKGPDGLSLKERITVRGLSYWWLAMPLLFPDVRRCIRLIDAFHRLYDHEDPQRVVVTDATARPMLPFRLDRSADVPGRVAALVARHRGIDLSPVSDGLAGRLRFWNRYLGRRLMEIAYTRGGELWWGRLRRLAAATSSRGQAPRPAPRCLVHLSTPAYWRRSGEETPARDDVFAGGLLRRIAERPGWRVLDVDTEVNLPTLAGLGKVREKARRPGVGFLPIEALYDRGVRRRAATLRRHVRDTWREAKRGDDLRRGLRYRGIDLWSLVGARFDYAFEGHSVVALRHLEAVFRLFERERPDVVTMEFEEGSYGRAAIVAGQQMGVPTLAMQHGIFIDPYIPSYYYRRVATATGDPGACPVATKTAVFGEVTRTQLIRISAYPSSAVEVTGSAAFDALASARKRLDRDGSRQRLGLPAGVRVVTVMANRFWGPQYWQWFVDTLFCAARRLSGWRWVIKLHPHDTAEGYLQAAERAGVAAPMVLRDGLWPAIAAADAVVACYTTTILDAMALSRPVVFPVIPGMEDALGLAGSGGVIAVEDADQLATALTELTGDADRSAGQVRKAMDVLARHLHGVDGRASERLSQLALELAGETAQITETKRSEVVEHA